MNKLIGAAALLLPLLAGCAMFEDDPDTVAVDQNGSRIMSGALRVPVSKITADGIGQPIGTLLLMDSRAGLRIEAALGGLPPGPHGLHVHEKGDCGSGMKDGKMQAGIAAGSHYDPAATANTQAPWETDTRVTFRCWKSIRTAMPQAWSRHFTCRCRM